MTKLIDKALKLVLPTATAKASAYPVGCHAGCGRNGVYRPAKKVNGKLPCC